MEVEMHSIVFSGTSNNCAGEFTFWQIIYLKQTLVIIASWGKCEQNVCINFKINTNFEIINNNNNNVKAIKITVNKKLILLWELNYNCYGN